MGVFGIRKRAGARSGGVVDGPYEKFAVGVHRQRVTVDVRPANTRPIRPCSTNSALPTGESCVTRKRSDAPSASITMDAVDNGIRPRPRRPPRLEPRRHRRCHRRHRPARTRLLPRASASVSVRADGPPATSHGTGAQVPQGQVLVRVGQWRGRPPLRAAHQRHLHPDERAVRHVVVPQRRRGRVVEDKTAHSSNG